jgi:periplasmic copper chaperone A
MNRSSVSLPRPFARAAVVLLAAFAVVMASIGIASAHVTVSSPDAAPGGFGKITFRVPNESDTASTVSLRIQIPEEAALASLRVQPVPGWTATMTRSDLAEPLDNHGEEITSYVSLVEFRADGPGIRPGEFQEFSLSGGPFPERGTLTFPTVQTYSDGSESAWIEPTVDGEDEPERPAPLLTLTAARTGDAGTSTDPATAEQADDDSGPGTIALIVAIVALLVGFGGAALGWRAGRRTVSS